MRSTQHRDNWITRLLRLNCGQALIETALVVPVLMMILVGGVELARIEYASIEVANAAKAAVQYGAQGLGTFGDQAGMLAAAQYDAHDVNIPNPGGLSLWYSYSCSDGTVVAASGDCSATSTPYTVLNIDIQANFDTLLHFPGIPSTITLHGHATQTVLEQY
jgi:Flp pilus assembly protein TadG